MPEKKEDLAAPVMEAVIDVEKEELKQRLSLLEKMFLDGTKKQEEKQPTVSDFQAPLVKPKRILFTIGATQDEDAMHEGAYIPGKAVVSLFKFRDELKCNQYGTHFTTGFEYDEIEQQQPDLKGEDLQEFIKEVRIARQWIERRMGVNLDAGNKQFWQDRVIKIEDFDRIYDTDASLDNLILYYNILGGGYTQIARNYDDAKSNREAKDQRLYMSIQADEQERKFNHRGTLIEATAELQDILKNWSVTDALYLLYFLPIKKQKGYHAGTPMQTLINEFADFIEGVDTKTEKKKRPQQFIDALKLFKKDKDTIRITAIYKAAQYYGFILFNKIEKTYKNRATGFSYGNTEKGAVDALKNPTHLDELSWLKAKVNEKWLK